MGEGGQVAAGNAAHGAGETGLETIDWDGSTVSAADAGQFVGPNSDRYWFKWQGMRETGSKLSWNWSSALFGIGWLASRGMHGPATVVLAGAAIVGFVAGVGGSGDFGSVVPFLLLVAAICFVGFGLTGNRLYWRRTAAAAKAAREAESVAEARHTRLALTGGRNVARGAAWGIGACALFAVAAGLGLAMSTPDDAGAALATQSPQSPNDRYFSQQSFYSPEIIRMLYEQDIAALNTLPDQARGPVTIYAIYVADQVEETCGEFLSFVAMTARGVMRAAVGVISVGAAIDAIAQDSTRQEAAIRDWFQGIRDISAIETQARRDATVFLRDVGTCVDKRVYQLQDGLDRYFSG